MNWAVVIHRKGGAFRFLVRDGYRSRQEAERAKHRIWKKHRIRWLKVERCEVRAMRSAARATAAATDEAGFCDHCGQATLTPDYCGKCGRDL